MLSHTLVCESCHGRLRLPDIRKRLFVRCPHCGYRFLFRSFAFGLSTSSRRPAKAGVVAGLAAAALYELISRSTGAPTTVTEGLFQNVISMCVVAAALGGILGAAEGIFPRDARRIRYGAAFGVAAGLLSGLLAGAIGFAVFRALVLREMTLGADAWFKIVLARTVTWTLMGAMVGAALGIMDNTVGDLKAGFLGGALGGALGGLLFDGIAAVVPAGNGSVSRVLLFSVMGAGISVASARLREIGVIANSAQMYEPISERLPVNRRLLLPARSAGDAEVAE